MFFLICGSGAGALASAVLMFVYQPIVASIAVASSLVMFVVPLLCGRHMAHLEKKRSDRFSLFTGVLKDLLGGFEVIASFGLRNRAVKRFEDVNQALLKDETSVGQYASCTNGLAQLLSGIAAAAIIAVSCLMVMGGKMTLGALVIFISLKTTFSSCLTLIMQAVPVIQGLDPVVEHIKSLTKANQPDVPKQPASFEKSIRISALRYGYQKDKPIIDGMNCVIAKGMKVALVGANGSGKTTLIRLLCGYFPDYEGSIQFDERELRDIDTRLLHRTIAVIHQNVYMFDDTIAFNITLGEEFCEEALDKALRLSGVYEFAALTADGIAYQVGENGVRLSGGQRQRIAIARALIRNTPILILDEATSAVDEKTSYEIEQQLLGMEGLTLISITHDTSKEHLAQYDDVISMASHIKEHISDNNEMYISQKQETSYC